MAAELEPVAPELNSLPDARDFGRMIEERVNREIIRVRGERGEVTAPADTYDLVRGLTKAHEQLGDYQAALSRVNDVIRLELAEELMAIPGNEQDGTPLAGLTVPDEDGTDIKLGVEKRTKREFDTDALVSVAVSEQLTEEAVYDVAEAAVESAVTGEDAKVVQLLGEMIEAAVRRALSLGSFTPQITKVERYAKDAAGAGRTSEAAVVQGAVRTWKVYDKVSVKREERK